jgi:hypothetical protein
VARILWWSWNRFAETFGKTASRGYGRWMREWNDHNTLLVLLLFSFLFPFFFIFSFTFPSHFFLFFSPPYPLFSTTTAPPLSIHSHPGTTTHNPALKADAIDAPLAPVAVSSLPGSGALPRRLPPSPPPSIFPGRGLAVLRPARSSPVGHGGGPGSRVHKTGSGRFFQEEKTVPENR